MPQRRGFHLGEYNCLKGCALRGYQYIWRAECRYRKAEWTTKSLAPPRWADQASFFAV